MNFQKKKNNVPVKEIKKILSKLILKLITHRWMFAEIGSAQPKLVSYFFQLMFVHCFFSLLIGALVLFLLEIYIFLQHQIQHSFWRIFILSSITLLCINTKYVNSSHVWWGGHLFSTKFSCSYFCKYSMLEVCFLVLK